jgi:tetratricopeptide (TPR) repeat protein
MSFVKGPGGPLNEHQGTDFHAFWFWTRMTALVLSVPAAFYGMHVLRNPDPLLSEARQLLQFEASGAEAAPPLSQVRRAKQVLQKYLQRSERDANSVALLLLVCDWYEGRTVDAPRALDDISLAECSTRELAAAAMVAFHVNDFPSADRLIAAALDCTGSDRERVLRAASVIRFDSGRHEDVLEHCRELSELAPDDPRPWIVIASVYESRSDWMNVVANYQEVLARTLGKGLFERQTMIGFLLKSASLTEARREFDALLRDWPGLSDVDPLLEARLLFQEGNAVPALPHVARAVHARPDNAEALLLLGKIQFENGDLEHAAISLERVIAIEPLNHEARYVLGQVYYRCGQPSDSEHMFEVYRQLINIKSALFNFEARASRNPHDLEARRELIRIYDQLGLKTKADAWRKGLGQPAGAAQESHP